MQDNEGETKSISVLGKGTDQGFSREDRGVLGGSWEKVRQGSSG